MIFCEGFIPPSKRFDPEFDRRDAYLITQNALADGTYLDYIRAHYNRSTQIDPPFFQNFFPRAFRGLTVPLDRFFTNLGNQVEKRRRTGTSHFKDGDFLDLKSFAAKLREHKDPVSDYIFQNLKPSTQSLLSGSDESKLRVALSRDLNAILEKPALAQISEYGSQTNVNDAPLYSPQRFKNVKLSDHSQRFIKENPQGFTRIRWNRLLLEDAYGKEIAKSKSGVYPDLEIHTPSEEDSKRAFNEYIEDAQRRYQLGQMKPGEDFKIENGRVQVSGQVAVMSINGILTKMIFDANPGHDFYVEESFPLDWMYPYLSPSGIIMKINRKPLSEITQKMVDDDHLFWSKYSDRLIGNWITYNTSVQEICDFAERTYLHHNYKGFKGDRKFARDDNAQKAFSKLRSSIGGIYAWRVGNSKSGPDQQRMIKEAEFAFKQAFAYCPFSPEAVFRYVNLLLSMQRFDDAIAIVKTCQKLDPFNTSIDGLLSQVEAYKNGSTGGHMPQGNSSFSEAVRLIQNHKTNEAIQLLGQILSASNTDTVTLMGVAQAYVQLGMVQGAEAAVQRVVSMSPDNPEAWYNLGGLQAAQGKLVATQALKKAFELADQRRKQDPKAIDLREHARNDPNLAPIRNTPEFQKLVGK
jgi:tetratricopeptide (TPR) repeat protein